MFRTRRLLLAAVPVLAAGLAIALRAPAEPAVAQRPNILLYVIDTLRADHVGAYGYPRETTPRIDAWAGQSALFTNAHATAPWTKPSMGSVMTALYPPTHQLLIHGAQVGDDVPTLASILHAAGYRTLGASSNPFTGSESGLDRGYDQFLNPGAVSNAHPGVHSSAALNRIAFDWLDTPSDQPLFLFLHSMDPHMPYQPPPPYNRVWADPAEDRETRQWVDTLSRIRRSGGGMLASPADCRERDIPGDILMRRLIDRYDGEIAHNDARFGELLDHLEEKGLLDKTLIVLLSDHGEAFFDHGWSSHGTNVYAEEIRALLAFGGPGLPSDGRRIPVVASLVDVLPTILDLAGIETPESVQGSSLLPFILGRKAHRSAFAIQYAERKPARDCPPRDDTSTALITTDWKLILNESDPESVELYAASDPTDATNVAENHPGMVYQLRRALDTWQQVQAFAAESHHEPEILLDEDTRRQLEALGYMR